jgi:hypothetical protein
VTCKPVISMKHSQSKMTELIESGSLCYCYKHFFYNGAALPSNIVFTFLGVNNFEHKFSSSDVLPGISKFLSSKRMLIALGLDLTTKCVSSGIMVIHQLF